MPESNTYEMAEWEAYGKAVCDWAICTFGCEKFSVPATQKEWTGVFYLRFPGDQRPPLPLELNASDGLTPAQMGGLLWLTMRNPIPWDSGWMAGMVRDGKRKQFIQNSNTQLSFEGTPPGSFLFEDQVWTRYETGIQRTSV